MEDISKSQWYLTYDEVVLKAQLIQPPLAADWPAFSAYDKWYSPDVNAELLICIDKGKKDFSESGRMTEIKRVTHALDHNLAEAIHWYKDLIYYVDHAFGKSDINRETFGHSGFTEARRSVKKMIALLNHALCAISQQGNEIRLLKAYMPFYLPVEMANLVIDMSTGYEKLKSLKQQQLQVTRERIELYNFLWDTLSKICEDAQCIFAGDNERLEIYDLYEIRDWHSSRVQVVHLN
ncbi:MAG TPA: hypothetical protein VFG54_11110 [Prolixibacteraceae bacterium]|nr:hypothetical protein [Prolixibacteraceae bacterium]